MNEDTFFKDAVCRAHHEDRRPAQATAACDLADEQRAGAIERRLEDELARIEDEGQRRRVEGEHLAKDWREEVECERSGPCARALLDSHVSARFLAPSDAG